MMVPKKHKAEIIDIKLDINLDEEIKKYTSVDPIVRNKIYSIIDQAKARVKQPDPAEIVLNEKFEQLFILLSNNITSKQNLLKFLEIEPKLLSGILMKFKRFLRIVKNNQWVLVLDKASGDRTYSVVRFSDDV